MACSILRKCTLTYASRCRSRKKLQKTAKNTKYIDELLSTTRANSGVSRHAIPLRDIYGIWPLIGGQVGGRGVGARYPIVEGIWSTNQENLRM